MHILLLLAGWQSGYAAACKAVYAGSIPASASNFRLIKGYNNKNFFIRRKESSPSGGIGRHKGLKIPR